MKALNCVEFSKKLLLCWAVVLIFAQCKPDKQYNPELTGPWQGREWLIENKPSDLDGSGVRFHFNADGSYSAQYGTQAEKGTWYNRGDKLYTTAENKKEILTKYIIEGSTLRIEMNRGGRAETIILSKQ